MLTIAVLLITIGCAIASAINQKIIGGQHAEDGQFPYQVSLRLVNQNNVHFCGGSIISSQWILTAAHCTRPVNNEPSALFVVAGTNYLDRGGERYNVSNVISHEDYYENETTLVNDISLLKINGNIELGNKIKTIDLATAEIAGGLNVTLSGWGLTHHVNTTNPTPEDKAPNDLQYATLTSLTVTECQKRVPEKHIFSTHLCTIAPVGQGAYTGDSGGPLVYGSQQIGVVSWGILPGAVGKPDIFASVSSYRSWIKNKTGV